MSPAHLSRVVCLCVAATLLAGCGTPQVTSDEAVFNELDALYTAVTSKRNDLLTASRERLQKLHADGKLSDSGFAAIDKIAARAADGHWSEAAEKLYDFMRAQRNPPKT